MANKTLNTKKWFKISAILYAILIVAGIVMTVVFGPKLDINFSGGTRIAYSYTGEIAQNDFSDTVATALDKEFTVSQNTSLSGDVNSYVITLVGKNMVDLFLFERRLHVVTRDEIQYIYLHKHRKI